MNMRITISDGIDTMAMNAPIPRAHSSGTLISANSAASRDLAVYRDGSGPPH